MTPLRARLFNPPNAVPDTGIDLCRQEPVQSPVARFVPKVVAAAPLAPKPIRKSWLWPGNLIGEFWLSEDCPLELAGTTMHAITDAVCKVWWVAVSDIRGPRRFGEFIVPRHVAMCLCHKLTQCSMPQIAKFFGGRDHTTVLHAVDKLRPTYDAVKLTVRLHATPREFAEAMKARLS